MPLITKNKMYSIVEDTSCRVACKIKLVDEIKTLTIANKFRKEYEKNAIPRFRFKLDYK